MQPLQFGHTMNKMVDCVVTAVASSAIGSLALWAFMAIHPESTAGLSLQLYASIFILSSIVVLICTSILLFAFRPIVTSLSRLPVPLVACLTAVFGGCTYVGINVAIMGASSDKGVVWKFFGTLSFLYPLIIGAVYGAAFGAVYRIRHPQADQKARHNP